LRIYGHQKILQYKSFQFHPKILYIPMSFILHETTMERSNFLVLIILNLSTKVIYMKMGSILWAIWSPLGTRVRSIWRITVKAKILWYHQKVMYLPKKCLIRNQRLGAVIEHIVIRKFNGSLTTKLFSVFR
jgi:uncharacterized membrane protein